MKRLQYFANAAKAAQTFFFSNQFQAVDSWVQLAPFGDFANVDNKGNKVIQRMDLSAAQEICNSFNAPGRMVMQPLGVPWYVGHPDHPRFKNQPGHTDTSAKGRGKEMQVRHDASCSKCQAFANTAIPCETHGLFIRVKWNEEGEHLIANEAYHGHSVNWAALPAEMENGIRIWRPIRVRSVGFTNDPNIPVPPASLANEAVEDEDETNNKQDKNMIIPPWLKVLAGFKADEDVTEQQVQAALEKLFSDHKANEQAHSDEAQDRAAFLKWMHELLDLNPDSTSEADLKAALQGHVANSKLVGEVKKANETLKAAYEQQDKAHNDLRQAYANEQTARGAAETKAGQLESDLANQRSGYAQAVVDLAVRDGRVILAQREAKVTELLGAENFANAVQAVATGAVIIKTTAKTSGLGGQHAEMLANVNERQSKWMGLMNQREQDFPNETYDQRYAAVSASEEGKLVLAQMTQPSKETK